MSHRGATSHLVCHYSESGAWRMLTAYGQRVSIDRGTPFCQFHGTVGTNQLCSDRNVHSQRYITWCSWDLILHQLSGEGVPCHCGKRSGTPVAAGHHLFHAPRDGTRDRCAIDWGSPLRFVHTLMELPAEESQGFCLLSYADVGKKKQHALTREPPDLRSPTPL